MESNHRHRDFQSLALPTELQSQNKMAVPTRIELAIFCVTGRRDNRYTTEPLVAGAGFEPTTFGLWARRATRLLPSRDNIYFKLAEEKGFEPLRRFHDLSVFKTDPFNRTWVFLHAFFWMHFDYNKLKPILSTIFYEKNKEILQKDLKLIKFYIILKKSYSLRQCLAQVAE